MDEGTRGDGIMKPKATVLNGEDGEILIITIPDVQAAPKIVLYTADGKPLQRKVGF